MKPREGAHHAKMTHCLSLNVFDLEIFIISLSSDLKTNQLMRRGLVVEQPTTLNEWRYGGMPEVT
jgi:hypothetical protein